MKVIHKILAKKGNLLIDFILVNFKENECTNVLVDVENSRFDKNQFIGVWNVTHHRFKGIKEFREFQCKFCNNIIISTKALNCCDKCKSN